MTVLKVESLQIQKKSLSAFPTGAGDFELKCLFQEQKMKYDYR